MDHHDTHKRRKNLEAIRHALDRLDEQDASPEFERLRDSQRFAYRTSPLVVELAPPSGPWVRHAAIGRNISRTGAAMLVNQFVYPGTACRVHLLSIQGARLIVRGQVRRCRYLERTGSLYEVGVRFEQPVEVALFHKGAATVRILLVDDDESLHRLVGHLLKKRNVDLTAVLSAEEALTAVEQREVDLALVDLDLPGMSGLELIRILRQQGFARPLIAVTASTGPEVRKRCLEAGSTSYAPKPLTGELLVELLDSFAPERLVSTLAGEADLAPLIDQFVVQLGDRVRGLEEAFCGQDYAALERLARTLKGEGGSYGFDPITTAAQTLEFAVSTEEAVQEIRLKLNDLIRWCLAARPCGV